MATILIKLKNPGETVLFQSIIVAHSHLAWVRTEDSGEGALIKLYTTDDLADEVREVIRTLKGEIEFEEIHNSTR